MLTDEQVRHYLERIGYGGPLEPTAEVLSDLMMAHLTHIPFETVGLARSGKAPDLALEALYRKMVEEGNGGYCFELNKLFESLLVFLGFNARPILCRSADTPGQLDPINHRGLAVNLDGRLYSADVGFGGPMPAAPVLLEDGVVQDVTGMRVIVRRLDDAWWRIDRFPSAKGSAAKRSAVASDGISATPDADTLDVFLSVPGSYETDPGGSAGCGPIGRRDVIPVPTFAAEPVGVLELCTARVHDVDFESLNLMCSMEGTEFRDVEMANLRLADGHAALTGTRLSIRDARGRRVTELSGREEVDAALTRHFGISYR